MCLLFLIKLKNNKIFLDLILQRNALAKNKNNSALYYRRTYRLNWLRRLCISIIEPIFQFCFHHGVNELFFYFIRLALVFCIPL